MENVQISRSSLFWQKLGKWQIMATCLTLATYFVALHFTGNKESAVVITIIILAIVFGATVIFATASAATVFITIILATSAAAGIAISGVVSKFDINSVALAVLLSCIPAFIAADEGEKHGMRQGVVWLSFAMMFAGIFFPISLA